MNHLPKGQRAVGPAADGESQTKASRVAELTVVIAFAISIGDAEVSKAVYGDYLPKAL